MEENFILSPYKITWAGLLESQWTMKIEMFGPQLASRYRPSQNYYISEKGQELHDATTQ